MTLAVDRDHQSDLVTVEIHDERANWMLAPKLEASQFTAAQEIPEDSFRHSSRSSEVTSTIG
jgi:hypothetical protein